MRWGAVALLVAAMAWPHPAVLAAAVVLLALGLVDAANARRRFVTRLHDLPCLDGPAHTAAPPGGWPTAAVLAPARNEADVVGRSVRGFVALDYPRLHVLVVQDHSTDATPALLDAIAGESDRLAVLHDPPRQEGWLGKPNAVWHGMQAIDPDTEWVLLCDADTLLQPPVLKRAIAHCEREGLALLTCVPRLDNHSFWEELLLPMYWHPLIASVRAEALNTPEHPPVGVGAFMLMRRRAYVESGGHSRHVGEHPEDALLAGAIRDWGGKIGVAWASQAVRVRLYPGLRAAFRILTTKFRVRPSGNLPSVFRRMPLMLMRHILPLCVAAACGLRLATGGRPAWLLAAGVAVGLASYALWSRAIAAYKPISSMRGCVPYLHPLAGLMTIALHVNMALSIVLNRPLEWRGRKLTPRRPDGPSTPGAAPERE
jgi:hypothetical protein